MTSKINERVKVQLRVFKPLDCYSGIANNYFVAVVGPGIQLGNNNTTTAPRCTPVGRIFWGKDLWLPKNSTIEYKFLVVRACTGVVTDIETINPHKIYIGQKSIIIEHTYNNPAFDGREDNNGFKRGSIEKGRKGKNQSTRHFSNEVGSPYKRSIPQSKHNGRSHRNKETTKKPKDSMPVHHASKRRTENAKVIAGDEWLPQNDKSHESLRDCQPPDYVKESMRTYLRKDIDRSRFPPDPALDEYVLSRKNALKLKNCTKAPSLRTECGVSKKEEKVLAENGEMLAANSTDMNVPSQGKIDKKEVCEEIGSLEKTPENMLSQNDETTEIEQDITANTTDMNIYPEKETDMRDEFEETTNLQEKSEAILSQNYELEPQIEDVKQMITENTEDMTMFDQSTICNTENCIELNNEALLQTNAVAEKTINIMTDTASDNMSEDIGIETAVCQNKITDTLLPGADTNSESKDVEIMIEIQNGAASVKGDHSRWMPSVSGKSLAMAAAGVAVVSCIGYYVFFRK